MPSPVAVAQLKRLANARLRREEEGQDLLDTRCSARSLRLVALGAVTTVGNTINTVFWQVIAQTV